jgi:hypothetical protein
VARRLRLQRSPMGVTMESTLDLTDAAVRKMIKAAKKLGYVTHDQVNAVLSSSDQIRMFSSRSVKCASMWSKMRRRKPRRAMRQERLTPLQSLKPVKGTRVQSVRQGGLVCDSVVAPELGSVSRRLRVWTGRPPGCERTPFQHAHSAAEAKQGRASARRDRRGARRAHLVEIAQNRRSMSL